MKKRYKFLVGFLSTVATVFTVMFTWYMFSVIKNKPDQAQSQGEFLFIIIGSSGGHTSAAKGVQAKLSKLGYTCDIIDLDMYDPLGLGQQYEQLMTNEFGRLLLKRGVTRTYWTTGSTYFGIGYDIIRSWIDKGNYKCIVSFMPFTYKMVQHALQRDNSDIPYVIVPTDWEDAQLGSGLWIAGPNAIYILGTQRLWEQCPETHTKYKVDGMIIRPEFVEDVKTAKERCEELGLPFDQPRVCVMFGKCASLDMVKTALVMRDKKEYHFIFLCGSNKDVKESVESIKNEFGCDHYTVYGFIKPHKVMQASTVFIGKPGPGALSEAMACKLPILVCENDTLIQEIYNAKRVKQLGIAEGFVKPAELPVLLQNMLKNYDKYMKAYEQVEPIRALDQICDILVDVLNGKIKNPHKNEPQGEQNTEVPWTKMLYKDNSSSDDGIIDYPLEIRKDNLVENIKNNNDIEESPKA